MLEIYIIVKNDKSRPPPIRYFNDLILQSRIIEIPTPSAVVS